MTKKLTVEEFFQKAHYEGFAYAVRHYFGKIDENFLKPDERVDMETLISHWNRAVEAMADLEQYICDLSEAGLIVD